MEPITVHFKLGEQEYLDACRLLNFRDAKTKARLACILVLLTVCCFLMLAVLRFPFVSAAAAAVLTGLLTGGLVVKATRDAARRFYRGDPKWRAAQTITFADEGVAVRSKELDSKLGWKLYTGALEGEGCYVLLYGKDVRMVTIVPKRAFKNRAQEQDFRRLVLPRFDQTTNGRALAGAAPVNDDDYEPRGFEPPDWRQPEEVARPQAT